MAGDASQTLVCEVDYINKRRVTVKQCFVYVQDMHGNPLMPTRRFGKVRRMLDAHLAVPVTTVPFTIRLTYEPETHVLQQVVAGPADPGRTNIGAAAVRSDGTCLRRI